MTNSLSPEIVSEIIADCGTGLTFDAIESIADSFTASKTNHYTLEFTRCVRTTLDKHAGELEQDQVDAIVLNLLTAYISIRNRVMAQVFAAGTRVGQIMWLDEIASLEEIK